METYPTSTLFCILTVVSTWLAEYLLLYRADPEFAQLKTLEDSQDKARKNKTVDIID